MTASIGKVRMFWSALAMTGLCVLAGLGFVYSQMGSAADYDGPAKSSGPQGEALASLITQLRQQKKLVGLAAMVTVDGEVVATAAVGERMVGRGVSVDPGDRWHLGSITKSITATMIARLIEAGQMQWTDTVGQSFADAPIHEGWKAVTLEQLLTHTAGAPPNMPLSVRRKKPAPGAECTRERRLAVIDVMAAKPVSIPGEKFAYSNVGYTIAAAMAEKTTGVSWEDLVKREVFEPLELNESGFGPPKSPTVTLDQPRGHISAIGRKMGMGDDADNTPIIGPSGTVHMSLANLTKYGTEHLRGQLGSGTLLKAETYRKLHQPKLGGYACGWIEKPPNARIPQTVYWHNGSNTMWYALVAFIPETRMVVAVTSNDGDIKGAEAAAWEIVRACAGPGGIRSTPEAEESYAKKSPFAAVRWSEKQPEVQVGGEWFKLVSLDMVSASEIVAFSEKTFGARWRMRFEEDLVELLTKMGHPPKDTVTLEVQPLTSPETRTLENVRMTEENRQAIKRAAMQRGD